MSYQPRIYQSQWQYDPTDLSSTDFKARVGHVLSKGITEASLKRGVNLGVTQTRKDPSTSGAALKSSDPAEKSVPAPANGTSNYAWVDENGRTIKAAQLVVSPESTQTSTEIKHKIVSQESINAYHAQVQELWKRVNPGVMPEYAETPEPTTCAHFKWQPEEIPNKRHNFKKTDFSEYVEAAARFMNQLVTQKDKA